MLELYRYSDTASLDAAVCNAGGRLVDPSRLARLHCGDHRGHGCAADFERLRLDPNLGHVVGRGRLA